jgi:hypothetical protein
MPKKRIGEERHALEEAQREIERISTKAKRPAGHQMLAEPVRTHCLPGAAQGAYSPDREASLHTLPKPGRGYVVGSRLSDL